MPIKEITPNGLHTTEREYTLEPSCSPQASMRCRVICGPVLTIALAAKQVLGTGADRLGTPPPPAS
jgi:hypothetical protein